MSSPAAAHAAGIQLLDEATLGVLLTKAVASRTGPVRLVGPRLHQLAAHLTADGIAVSATAPGRRHARALRRTGAPVTVTDLRLDLPYDDSSIDVLVCHLGPRTFPFPRRTVRELGRAVAPGGLVFLLPDGRSPWPRGLVDAWAAAAGLLPCRDNGADTAQSFSGAIYEPRP